MRQTRISLAGISLLFSTQSFAQTTETHWETCQNPESLPLFQPLSTEQSALANSAQPAYIYADAFNVQKQDESVFEGHVELQRGREWMATDKLHYNHNTEQYRTEGQVRFQNETLRMTAENAKGDHKADTIELSKLQYQFNVSNGNGTADAVSVHGKTSKLSKANFSTCPSNQQEWQFVADQIELNEETHRGVAKNATLKIGGIPVFWLPIMRFPTTSDRASGFLAPKIGEDSLNGIDISLPYYINLAPNYDTTLTPRYLSNRGFMLGSEFRYLFDSNKGEFSATFLPNDEIRADDRYLLGWSHFIGMNRSWYFDSDLNHVSDVNYFSDFGKSINETSTALLQSSLGFHGRGKFWNLELTASSWEIANPTQTPGSEPYRRLPRLAVSGSKPIVPWLELGLNAEAVAFKHEQLEDGNRLDIEPYVKLPITGTFWYVTPSLSWRQTEYWLGNNSNDVSHLSRGLSIFSVDAGASFERSDSFAGQSFIQTLEPRLFYLNVPYRNQDAIPVFDTQALTFMWPALFRENRYGGADRQTDANQMTLALTSRFLNADTGKERMNFSLGRITYFDAPLVHLPNEALLPDDGSAWVAEANVRLSDQWQIAITEHWNPATTSTDLSAVRAYWSLPNGLQINASYRYRVDFAEQSDVAFVIPIDNRWRAIGRWSYSLRDNQNLDSMLGFEWKSCCMALRLIGRKYIRSFDSRENLGIFLELELNGIGQIGSKPELFKDNGILAY